MSKGTFIERPLGATSAASPASAPHQQARPSPRVSVIVPVYNGQNVIEGCLRSLDRQTLPADEFEVIVIDDGSTDETRAIVRRVATSSRASIVLVEQQRNGGPAAARNAGLALAGSPVIAFTDADCEASSTWLERGLQKLDADPTLAAIEGATLPKGEKDTFTHQMENTRGRLYMTCNMIYRSVSLSGGFDERFRLAFLEDSDVAFNVMERGGRIEFSRDVVVHHLVLHEGRKKFWKEARKRFYNPLLKKKHPKSYAADLKPVVPAFPSHYLNYMLAAGITAVALATRAWIAGGLMIAYSAWMLKAVAFSLRARGPLSIAQAALVPFVQTFWAIAGMVRFGSFSPRI